jgi:DNA-binding LacI/PurR family transcriptional regulator
LNKAAAALRFGGKRITWQSVFPGSGDYRRALAEAASIDVKPELVIHGEFQKINAYANRQLLKVTATSDGILPSNDRLALVPTPPYSFGLQLPHDVALVGFQWIS